MQTYLSYKMPSGRGNNSPVHVGLIGCGYWGSKLLRVFNKLDTAEVNYVCDQIPQRQAWISENYPHVKFFTDYRDVLQSNCDAVIIATPAESHYAMARDSLAAGKHVFVEKPLALNQQSAEELRKSAELDGLKLFTGHTFEFDPAIRTIRRIVDSGELGRIFYVDSVRSNLGLLRLDVNIIWDLLIHDVSILLAIFGCLPVDVSAMGSSHITRGIQNICEFCQVNMLLPNSIRASAKASWLEPVKMRQLKIIGSRKSLVFAPTVANEVQIYDSGIELNTLEKTIGIHYRRGTYRSVQYSNAEPLTIEASAFIDSIIKAKMTNAQTAVEIIGVLDAMQSSLDKNGAWVQVNSDSLEPKSEHSSAKTIA